MSFSPVDGSPTQFEQAPNYDGALWTATVGSDLPANNGPGSVAAVAGSPNFTQSGFGNSLNLDVDLATVYGAGDHYYFCRIIPSSITTTSAANNAFLNQQVWMDGFAQMGLSLRKSGSNYFATYFERENAIDATCKFAEVQLVSQTADTVIQCKKSGGNLWIKQNNDAWVMGQACGNGANTTQTLHIGGYTHIFLGILVTEGFYDHVPGGSFDSEIVTWCNAPPTNPINITATVAITIGLTADVTAGGGGDGTGVTHGIHVQRVGALTDDEPVSAPLGAVVTVFPGTIALLREGVLANAYEPEPSDVCVGLIGDASGGSAAQASQGISGNGHEGPTGVWIDCLTGTFLLASGTGDDTLTEVDVGSLVYVIDEVSVGKTDGDGGRPIAGELMPIDLSMPAGMVPVRMVLPT